MKTSRKLEHLIVIYGSRRRPPFSRSQRLSADTGVQKLDAGCAFVSVKAAAALAVLLGCLGLRCCLMAPRPFLFNAISTLLLLASVGVASIGSSYIMYPKKYFGDLVILNHFSWHAKAGKQMSWPAAQTGNPACCPSAGTHLLCSDGLYSVARFFILSSWTALGSWGVIT